MPKVITDYSKTVIYKIQHQEKPEMLYIGSTTNFVKRKSQHKNRCDNEDDKRHNLKLYKLIRDNGGLECFKMLEIKKFPCENRTEAHQEEDRVYLEMKANMNDRRPHRNKKQYTVDNVEKKAEYDRNYRKINNEKIKDYKKKYAKDNAEKIKEHRKQYYVKNREKFLEYSKQKLTCECGIIITRQSVSDHKKSKKHIELMLNLHKCSSSQ